MWWERALRAPVLVPGARSAWAEDLPRPGHPPEPTLLAARDHAWGPLYPPIRSQRELACVWPKRAAWPVLVGLLDDARSAEEMRAHEAGDVVFRPPQVVKQNMWSHIWLAQGTAMQVDISVHVFHDTAIGVKPLRDPHRGSAIWGMPRWLRAVQALPGDVEMQQLRPRRSWDCPVELAVLDWPGGNAHEVSFQYTN